MKDTIETDNKCKANTGVRFFEPYVGKDYGRGIGGKRVLVLGASFYCPNTGCRFHRECTSSEHKDSSRYDNDCPTYASQGQFLSHEPSYSVTEHPDTYIKFAKALYEFVDAGDYNSVWDKVAFTNYVQFFLSGNGEEFRPTKSSDLSQRDFDAFIETVYELLPDIIIVWGCVINSSIKEHNPYVYDKDILVKNDWYLCHMILPGTDKRIAIVNPNHPSSRAWYSDMDQFQNYLRMAINE